VIVHLLMLRVRSNLTDAERREFDRAVESLASVPGVQSMSWGADFSGRAKGLTHGAVLHFADRDALDGYQRNEHHRAVVATLDRLTTEKLVIDYETDSSGISG
jgi:hypothetical protein